MADWKGKKNKIDLSDFRVKRLREAIAKVDLDRDTKAMILTACGKNMREFVEVMKKISKRYKIEEGKKKDDWMVKLIELKKRSDLDLLERKKESDISFVEMKKRHDLEMMERTMDAEARVRELKEILALQQKHDIFALQLKLRAESHKRVKNGSNNNEVKNKETRWCAVCPNPAIMQCCFNTYYCGPNCQRIHFKEHAKECKHDEDAKKAIKEGWLNKEYILSMKGKMPKIFN